MQFLPSSTYVLAFCGGFPLLHTPLEDAHLVYARFDAVSLSNIRISVVAIRQPDTRLQAFGSPHARRATVGFLRPVFGLEKQDRLMEGSKTIAKRGACRHVMT